MIAHIKSLDAAFVAVILEDFHYNIFNNNRKMSKRAVQAVLFRKLIGTYTTR